MEEAKFNIEEISERTFGYAESIAALFRLATFNDQEIDEIYKNLSNFLIGNKYKEPGEVKGMIFNALRYNNRFMESYLKIFRKLYQEYFPDIDIEPELNSIRDNLLVFHEIDPFYKAIFNDDVKSLIDLLHQSSFITCDNKRIQNNPYFPSTDVSLPELCCYYGAKKCFNNLFHETFYKNRINQYWLHIAIIGRNPDILQECLTAVTPDESCMEIAIATYNVDFITTLFYTCGFEIDPILCAKYQNLSALLVLLNETKLISQIFTYSPSFNFLPFCKLLLEQYGVDINTTNVDGDTALHYAVEYNNFEIAEFLISWGMKINVQNNKGISPLFLAVKNKNLEMTKFLIDHGADLNAQTKKGKGLSALHLCAKENLPQFAELLISKGADINLINEIGEPKWNNEKVFEFKGYTALHYAVNNITSYETAQVLVAHRANLNIKDNEGNTPLHLIQVGEPKIAELLILNGADVNAKNLKNQTPLQIFATLECIEDKVVELLISHGAALDIKDNNNLTPLQLNIIKSRFSGIADILISHGADINVTNEEGLPILHLAVKYNKYHIVEFLLRNGVDVDSKALDGRTALHIAADSNYLRIAKLLIINGADVNAKHGLFEKTPLHYAAENNYYESVAELLMAHGANDNALKITDDTLLRVAGKKNVILFRYLENYYDWNTYNLLCSENSGEKMIDLLISNNVDIYPEFYNIIPPMDIEADKNLFETIEYIISSIDAINIPVHEKLYNDIRNIKNINLEPVKQKSRFGQGSNSQGSSQGNDRKDDDNDKCCPQDKTEKTTKCDDECCTQEKTEETTKCEDKENTQENHNENTKPSRGLGENFSRI